jgi:hypothetical protein
MKEIEGNVEDAEMKDIVHRHRLSLARDMQKICRERKKELLASSTSTGSNGSDQPGSDNDAGPTRPSEENASSGDGWSAAAQVRFLVLVRGARTERLTSVTPSTGSRSRPGRERDCAEHARKGGPLGGEDFGG